VERESLEQFVPHYLTQDQKSGLQSALKAFPHKANYYDAFPQPGILQGDCFNYVPIRRHSDGVLSDVDCLVLSNTCDVDSANKRLYPASVVVTPLIALDAFRELLVKKGVHINAVDSHVAAIRQQAITNIFYLPSGGSFVGDRIARFDQCFSLSLQTFENAVSKGRRLASLSQLGFYILTFKVSLHFCRMHEGIARAT
jgi:hypothetical protein